MGLAKVTARSSTHTWTLGGEGNCPQQLLCVRIGCSYIIGAATGEGTIHADTLGTIYKDCCYNFLHSWFVLFIYKLKVDSLHRA